MSVTKTDTTKGDKDDGKKDDKPTQEQTDASTLHTIRHSLNLVHQAVNLIEPRFTTRALRAVPAIRNKLKTRPQLLARAFDADNVFENDSHVKQTLLEYLGNPSTESHLGSMEVDSTTTNTTPSTTTTTTTTKPNSPPLASLPEAEIYLSILVIIYLIDKGDYPSSQKLSEECIHKIGEWNRRTMDQLASRVYFYWVRSVELSKGDLASLRTPLLAAQRTAALRRDDDLQAQLLPLLLRNYIQHNLYDQADRLVAKTTFPEGTANNAQLARWSYYVGRIRAVQLNYSEAHANLQQAIRRAPPDAKLAPGFLQTAHKLLVVVELLMGEIPERKTFRQPVLKGALAPYLEIVQAVRIGDITKFNNALSTHQASFSKDSNYTLILRLRHNVIKTALRTLSLAYSRISLSSIRQKLSLESEEDAEYIVAKAIRDGVIDASVDHEKGEMRSKELGDVYATNEPLVAFDQRIRFLLDLHNQSVKAMRYPLNAHAKELASADEARERERELAKEIEDAEEDGELDGPGDMDSF